MYSFGQVPLAVSTGFPRRRLSSSRDAFHAQAPDTHCWTLGLFWTKFTLATSGNCQKKLAHVTQCKDCVAWGRKENCLVPANGSCKIFPYWGIFKLLLALGKGSKAPWVERQGKKGPESGIAEKERKAEIEQNNWFEMTWRNSAAFAWPNYAKCVLMLPRRITTGQERPKWAGKAIGHHSEPL